MFNRFVCVRPLSWYGPMIPRGLEEGMGRVCSIRGSLMVILDGDERSGVQGDAPEFLAFPNNVNDGLIPVGLEILDAFIFSMNQVPEIIEYRRKEKDLQSRWVNSLGGPFFPTIFPLLIKKMG